MKLSKKTEAEILKKYNAYWKNYIQGDVEAMRLLLSDKYTQVGSAEGEVFSNKKDAVQFLYDTIDQVAGKLEMRNRNTRLELHGNLVFLHELCDVYALSGQDWIFYSKFRATTIMQEIKGVWKIIHQHSSFPDARTGENENIAIDKVSEENQQLKEAIKRRTVELNQKNYDLRIEAALEKVRSVAMGMEKAEDMLAICKIISDQLSHLGVQHIRNVQTAIFYEQRGTYMNYEFYSRHNKTFITDTTYTNNKIHKAFASKMLKGKGQFFKTHIKGDKVKEWINYQKTTNVFIDKYLYKASSLNYYWYSLGPVALGISTYTPLSLNDQELFHRFLQVFELAYRRYQDIEKAQAQAREAHIEVAVERVRAQAMAMHQTNDLAKVNAEIYRQLTDLKIDGFTGVAIYLYDEKDIVTVWDLSSPGNMNDANSSAFSFDANHYPTLGEFVGICKSATEDYFLMDFPEKKLRKAVVELSHIHPGIAAQFRSAMKSGLLTHQWNPVARLANGILSIDLMKAPTEDGITIVKKMGAAFNLAYQRFLDLQKAEAQTRETQIQLALERVRARTMAMQKSDELPEAAALLFQQVQNLGMPAWSAGYCTWNNDKKESVTLWMSSEGVLQPPFTAPTTKDELFIQMRKGSEQGKTLHVVEMGGRSLVKHYQYMRTLPVVGEILDSIIAAGYPLPTFQIMHQAYFSKGFLLFITYEPVPEVHDLFKRFANVFDQTYTRFLDLQKAEAQAREAQIQVALERIRAKSLAMHSSADLFEVAITFREQMSLLGQGDLESSNIHFYNKNADKFEVWYTNRNLNHPDKPIVKGHTFVAKNACTWTKEIITRFNSSKTAYTIESKGEMIRGWYEVMTQVVPEVIDYDADGHIIVPEKLYYHFSKFSDGALLMITERPPSDEAKELQQRAANVFDFAYRRYLDLTQAEAQAREAQIEAALERVRSKTMAMHNSKEVGESVVALFDELTALGVLSAQDRCGIGIMQPDEMMELWTADKTTEKTELTIGHLNMKLHPLLKSVYQNWLDKKETYQYLLQGEDKLRYYEAIQNQANYKIRRDYYSSHEKIVHTDFFFKEGCLYVFSLTEFTPEETSIFNRFVNVFGQTFRRFLDLQKAEAQGRESQIQLALERVRARTMAMQKSDELAETAYVLLQQFNDLGLHSEQFTIGLIHETERTIEFWHTWQGGLLKGKVQISIDEPYVGKRIYDAWKSKKKSSVIDLSGEELKAYNRTRRKQLLKENPNVDTGFLKAEKRRVIHLACFSRGTISVSSHVPLSIEITELLLRFAIEFDQTYTRFLDLQKAEAQAREAQIEASLERVRSCSMAMHKSNELVAVVDQLNKEIQELGIQVDYTGIITDFADPQKGSINWIKSQKHLEKLFVPYIDHPVTKGFYDAIKKGLDYYVITLSKEEKDKYFRLIYEYSDFRKLPEERLKYVYSAPGMSRASVLSKNSILVFQWYKLIEISKEQEEIFKRFGKVFEQSFTRFLDLQKAEVQAREAQIDSALERVRSRSMGMQKSEELSEVIKLVFDQINILGVNAEHAGFVVDYQPYDDWHFWIADKNAIPSKITHPYFESVWAKQFNDAKEKGKDLFTTHLNFEEKNKFYLELLSYVPGLPEESKQFYLNCPGLAVSTALQENVSLYIENFSGTPYKEEENAILIRFGKVFQQTYTRFLDLQKAEAQARESQIEAALEKVRSRSLAMHKSDELQQVIKIVFEKLEELGIVLDTANINILSKDQKSVVAWLATKVQEYVRGFWSPMILEAEINKEMRQAIELSTDYYYSKTYTKEQKNEYLNELFEKSDFGHMPEDRKAWILSRDYYGVTVTGSKHSSIQVVSYEGKLLSSEQAEVLKRFARVFEQCYIRFLDLEKAEAQAREAQIEAALERVRSRSMGMQRGEDLKSVVKELYDQLKVLDFKSGVAAIQIMDEATGDMDVWMDGLADGYELPERYHVPYFDHPANIQHFEHWKKGHRYTVIEMHGQEKKAYDNYFFFHTDFIKAPEHSKSFMMSQESLISSIAYMKYGALGWAPTPLNGEQALILQRFAKVFDQTYTRFLDLQKAEAQAREAQIEAALERVRAAAMSMHRSEELLNVCEVLYKEVGALGFNTLRNAMINIHNDEKKSFINYDYSDEIGRSTNHLYYNIHPLVEKQIGTIRSADDAFSETYFTGRDLTTWKNFRKRIGEKNDPRLDKNKGLYYYFYSIGIGSIGISTFGPISEEKKALLKRFRNVFALSYQRYIDIAKAEAQAREAQIQLALERVRARTMAMQKSEELADAAVVLFQQFAALGETPDRISIGIVDEQNNSTDVWATDQAGTQINIHFKARNNEKTTIQKILNDWKAGKKSSLVDLHGDELKEWITYLRSELGMAINDEYFKGRRLHQVSFFSQGWLNITTLEPLPLSTLQLMDQFAAVFNLTYTRFADLKKAEAQAREAQIEAALEKVRSATNAMHESKHLLHVLSIIGVQLQQLGVYFETVNFSTDYAQGDGFNFWTISPGLPEPFLFHIPYFDHEIFRLVPKAVEKKLDFFTYLLNKHEKDVWFRHLCEHTLAQNYPEELKQKRFEANGMATSVVILKNNIFLSVAYYGSVPYPEESNDLIKRFGRAFEQSYTRFLDLQKAEAQAREAQIETALEKVRSRTLAMQKSDELSGTAAVLFQQLIALGIAPNRLFIIIIKEDHPLMEAWLTDEDGSKVNKGFTGDYTRNESLLKMYDGWIQQKKSLVIDMQGEELQKYFQYLHDELNVPFKGGLNQKRRLQHIAYFSHGLIGMASPEEQPAETITLLERFAAVFNLTFTRFNDLKIAEAHAIQAEQDLIAIKEAKQKAEQALTELQATQKQLIQSEKMASLGELTAGIAHEIQNPLNFVNNFSELNSELIKELKNEINEGHLDDAKAIAGDIEVNSDKINAHGKRAADIVKGMLQHSRKSSDQKEPTDINALCDEYLRLSYHGLRAKDKSFNATFETSFDDTIGLINIIPQEMGRVILNIINNAFYAVNEKAEQNIPEYKPTVTISTKKDKGYVLVTIADNGGGIPDHIKDKIFQPFFTTKPTGQGTGLGLSLAYDIIKAHGGTIGFNSTFIPPGRYYDLKSYDDGSDKSLMGKSPSPENSILRTPQEVGTEFIIALPIRN